MINTWIAFLKRHRIHRQLICGLLTWVLFSYYPMLKHFFQIGNKQGKEWEVLYMAKKQYILVLPYYNLKQPSFASIALNGYPVYWSKNNKPQTITSINARIPFIHYNTKRFLNQEMKIHIKIKMLFVTCKESTVQRSTAHTVNKLVL